MPSAHHHRIRTEVVNASPFQRKKVMKNPTAMAAIAAIAVVAIVAIVIAVVVGRVVVVVVTTVTEVVVFDEANMISRSRRQSANYPRAARVWIWIRATNLSVQILPPRQRLSPSVVITVTIQERVDPLQKILGVPASKLIRTKNEPVNCKRNNDNMGDKKVVAEEQHRNP